MRGLVVTLATAAIGCGSSGLVATDAGHDAAAVDAPLDVVFTEAWIPGADGGIDAPEELPDVGPPVPCEAGDYFITVAYDGGAMVLRNGCGQVPTMPTFGTGTCAEDCWPSDICGASDASTLSIAFGPGICAGVSSIGVYPIEVECNGGYWWIGGVTNVLAGGSVRDQDAADRRGHGQRRLRGHVERRWRHEDRGHVLRSGAVSVSCMPLGFERPSQSCLSWRGSTVDLAGPQ